MERKRAFEIVGTEVRELGGTLVGGIGTSRTAMPGPAQPMARVGWTTEPDGR